MLNGCKFYAFPLKLVFKFKYTVSNTSNFQLDFKNRITLLCDWPHVSDWQLLICEMSLGKKISFTSAIFMLKHILHYFLCILIHDFGFITHCTCIDFTALLICYLPILLIPVAWKRLTSSLTHIALKKCANATYYIVQVSDFYLNT